MCGIAVIISDRRDLAESALVRMTAALRHRGPDGTGSLALPGCWLGHTRLSIIDPQGGAQPMSDTTDRFHVTFNGEIFNFRDLRRDLEREGVVFRSRSDTETLLLAFRQWGPDAVPRLNGQFAFAIWDTQERRLFAARDRLGEKPLYFAESARGELLVASEIKALIASGMIDPTLDPAALDAYIALNYVPPCMTIYSNVHTLEPGHTLSWRQGRIERRRYWFPRLGTVDIPPADAALEVRRRLEVAVERQMIADTPVGAFLSGGLDSTTIVALMTRHTSTSVSTFAAGFGDLIDELPFAGAVAAAYGTHHAEKQMQIDVAQQLERMAKVYDEPFGDSSNIPTYLISEFARRDVKVALSGDGGDELFGGYEWYTPLLRQDDVSAAAGAYWWRKLDARACGMLSAVGLPLRARRDRAREDYKAIRAKQRHPDAWWRHLAALGACPSTALSGLSRDSTAVADRLSQRYWPDDKLHGIDRAVHFDVECYLPGDILVKVDRAAMAHGLESRSPFLDVDLVEFVWSLPASLRFAKGGLKPLLRAACQDLWPDVVRRRSKQGFGAPLSSWLQQPAVGALQQRVFGTASPLAHVIPAVTGLPRTIARKPQSLWNLLCLGLWLEKHSSCLGNLPLAA